MQDYKIAKLSDQVYEIQNFITQEELDQVMQFINLRNDSEWHEEDLTYEFWDSKVLNRKSVNSCSIFLDFYNRISALFSGNVDVTGINLQRYRMDDFLGLHTDDHEGHRASNQKVFYGAVLYYNDDYSGGELEYPDLNIVHKPKNRSLVIHGGKILHGTKPVKNDVVRYISTVFVKHHVDDKGISLNKDLFGEYHGV